MCGICGHPGPEHAVTLAEGQGLPAPGQKAPLCVDQCACCRKEVGEETDR